jgi:hypothetical protein
VPRSRQQPEPPDLFIDRSLGRHQVPDALRAAGFTVHTNLPHAADVREALMTVSVKPGAG